MSNPAREALTRAINRAIAEGAPVYVNKPAEPTAARIAMYLAAARAALSQPKIYPADKSAAFYYVTQARKVRLGTA